MYEFGDRAKSNKASKRPLTQANLKCNRWLKSVSLYRIPTPLQCCWPHRTVAVTGPHLEAVWGSRRYQHGALRALIRGSEQNCPKTPPISRYQGQIECQEANV